MRIKTVMDLFALYDFDDDLQLKIRQYLNANAKLLPQINALCLRAKIFKNAGTLIYPSTYLLKMGKMSIIYKRFEDKIKFIEIHFS